MLVPWPIVAAAGTEGSVAAMRAITVVLVLMSGRQCLAVAREAIVEAQVASARVAASHSRGRGPVRAWVTAQARPVVDLAPSAELVVVPAAA